MKRTSWSIVFSLLLVFLSGAVVGGVAHHLYTTKSVSAKTQPRTPEEYRRKYTQEMRSRLKLSDGQIKQLDVILDDTRARFKDFRDKTRPEMKRIHDEQVERVRAILNETQRQEYEKMRREREARSNPGGGC